MQSAHAKIAKTITHILHYYGVSQVPLHRTRITLHDFTVEIECKDTTILRGGKIYFAQRVIKKKAALVGTALYPLLLWDFQLIIIFEARILSTIT